MPGKCRQDMRDFLIRCRVTVLGVQLEGKRAVDPVAKPVWKLQKPTCISGAVWVAVPGALLNLMKEDVVDL